MMKEIFMEENSFCEMESVQIKGVDSTKRDTIAKQKAGARLVVLEKLMTHGTQYAETDFTVDMDGEGCSANLVSRSVAKGESKQIFRSNIKGNNYNFTEARNRKVETFKRRQPKMPFHEE